MKEKDLILKGFNYTLTFTQIQRVETKRRTEGGHDHRGTAPAFVWEGMLNIQHGSYGKISIVENFSTEVFFQDHAKGLVLEDIFFLCTNRDLFYVQFESEEDKKMTIDYIAGKILAEYQFANICFPDAKKIFPIDALRLYTANKDRLLVSRQVQTTGRKPRHGEPGKIIKPE